MNTQTEPHQGARITFPGAIHVGAEVFVETVAKLYATDDLLVDLNGGDESATSEMLAAQIDRLLTEISPDPDEYSRSPFAVEAFARGKELLAMHYEARGLDAGTFRDAASKIRQHQHISADAMNDAELEAIEDVS